MRNNTITAFLAIAVMAATIAQGTPEQDRLWSTRVTCELQTAGAQSLPALTFSQGSTPLLSLDQYRAGKSVNADSNIVARFVFGPTQTNQYYVAVTNYAVSGNGYLIQCPTIGTNTTAGAWWYTAYFESTTGHRYWTGNGRLSIVATTSTEDGLTWQEITSSGLYEPILPATPSDPTTKFLNGNREWSSISDGVLRIHDSAQPSRYFLEVVNSTGTVFEVTGPFTNLMVTLSDDFEETVTHTRPAWTNNVFPFTDGSWSSQIFPEYYSIWVSGAESFWISATLDLPATLTAAADAQGAATVSVASVYYTTNVFAHFTTEAELEAAKAACGVVLTNTVISATNALMPYSRTVYGDVTTTNETGYAAFDQTNAAVASYSALIPSSAVGSFTNTFRYYLNNIRKTGVLTNKAWFVKYGFGDGYKIPATLVSVKDAAGNTVASSYVSGAAIDQTVSTSVCVTNSLAIPLNVYSGTVELACIAVSTNASFSVRLYTGAQYTNLLTFSESPTAYAAYAELRSLREEIPAIIMSNSVSSLVVWTNDVGAATNMAWRENNVWHTNALGGGAALPDGIVTNGMGGPLTLGRVRFDETHPNIGVAVGTNTQWGLNIEGNPWDADGHDNGRDRAVVRIASDGTWIGTQYTLYVEGYTYLSGFRINGSGVDRNLYKTTEIGFGSPIAMRFSTDQFALPELRITPGVVRANYALDVAGTNTASVVVSQSYILFGPSIGGKQAFAFTDGTNCFFVNVNSVTNALTTN